LRRFLELIEQRSRDERGRARHKASFCRRQGCRPARTTRPTMSAACVVAQSVYRHGEKEEAFLNGTVGIIVQIHVAWDREAEHCEGLRQGDRITACEPASGVAPGAFFEYLSRSGFIEFFARSDLQRSVVGVEIDPINIGPQSLGELGAGEIVDDEWADCAVGAEVETESEECAPERLNLGVANVVLRCWDEHPVGTQQRDYGHGQIESSCWIMIGRVNEHLPDSLSLADHRRCPSRVPGGESGEGYRAVEFVMRRSNPTSAVGLEEFAES
jgi:hypothetical protein